MPVIDCIDIDAQEAKKVAIQPEFSTVKVNLSKTLSKIQTQIKGKIAVSEGEIAKILSVDATAVCSPSEVFVGEVRYCGRVNFSVIYLDKDGKNRNTQTSVEFSGKAENEDIKANSRARIVCSLLDCETIAVGDDEISLGAVVEVDITVFAEAESAAELIKLCIETVPVNAVAVSTRPQLKIFFNVAEIESMPLFWLIDADKAMSI